MTQQAVKPVGVGVVGLGMMGATHLASYASAAAAGLPCRVVAVADANLERLRGELGHSGGNLATGADRGVDPASLRRYERFDDLFDDREVDLVSICTPTPSHVQMAMAALKAGKHVLVEKPVALHAAEIRALDHVAREAGRICMPAMCMRFWPAWAWLKARIEDESLGELLSATFTRVGGRPAWAGFYADPQQSGGALVDLHIHDADFVRFCFGDPIAVSSAGRVGGDGSIDHVTTIYHYSARTPGHVVAEGGWEHPGTAFRMRYVATFERATADFEIGRSPELLLCRDGGAAPATLETTNGYDGEIRHLIQAIATRQHKAAVSLADAAAVADLLDAERRSVLTGQTVALRPAP